MTGSVESDIHLVGSDHQAAVTADPEAKIRLIIADPQPLVRRGLRSIFEAEPGLEVAGEVDNAEQLLILIRRRDPQVVVLDTDLPGADCLDLSRQLACEETGCEVVLIADTLNGDFAVEALRAGVRGLLYKDDRPADLVEAIKAVARGEALLAPRVTLAVLEELKRGGVPIPSPRREDELAIDTLTPRELQIFRHIAEGRTNQQIADELLLSEATIKSHFNRIGKKLGIRGRSQAVILAYRTGLVRTGK